MALEMHVSSRASRSNFLVMVYRGGGKAKMKVKDVEAALRASLGILTRAATILEDKYGSCSPTTVSNYIKRHSSLQKVQDEITNQTLDLAESKLIQLIKDGDKTAILFYLKCKGKDRGYIEKPEIEFYQQNNLASVAIKPDMSELDDDQLRALLNDTQQNISKKTKGNQKESRLDSTRTVRAITS